MKQSSKIPCLLALAASAFLSSAVQGQSTLSAFHDEADLQAYLQPIQAVLEAEQQKQKAELEANLAKRKAMGISSGSTGNMEGQTVAGATVRVENPATGFRREVTADANGNYAVRNLPIGTYQVTAEGKTVDVRVPVSSTSASGLEGISVVGGAVSTSSATDNDITNVQTAGVDEGGLVKKAGDFFVVLRRGRLFSIRADGKGMRLVSSSNAYAPGIDGSDAWYDEMLISGENLVVVGYSYHREGTEIGLFHLGKDGRISHRATYHLASYDYYSSSNYASRLIGNTLIFYSPVPLFSDAGRAQYPAVRRWKPNAPKAAFERIAPAERIYRSGIAEDSQEQLLHSVTRCDLSAADMDCHSTAVLGPYTSSFYVSREAVYLWMTSGDEWHFAGSKDDDESSVVRVPFDGAPPTALRALGSPSDQMCFLEKDGFLNVLVGTDAEGDRMWGSEANTGRLALLRVPLSAMGDSHATAGPEHYRMLGDGEGVYDLNVRYVGDWLLFGSGEARDHAYAVRIDRKEPATKLDLPQTVERVEAIGKDALFVGASRPFNWHKDAWDTKRDLYLTSVALGDVAKPVIRLVMPKAEQEDNRTHGFLYRSIGEQQGLFGLPIVATDEASIRYVRNDRLRLTEVGSLAATSVAEHEDADDACVASCYDWYGDSRPIFVGDRVYALMGYELVEGRLQGGRVRELRRLNFSPKPVKVAP